MNFRKVLICLASGLAFCAGLRAADLAMNNSNPYGLIVSRNVFNLNPPAPDAPAAAPDLPKITPNGIMGVFGHYQVLFKVIPVHKAPGDKEQFYMMSEGEQQDEIEVTHIDDRNNIVTFNNHGTVQEIPLAVAPSTGIAPPSPANPPSFGPPNGNNGQPGPGNRFSRFGNRGGGFNGNGVNNQNGGNNGNDGLNLRSIPTRTYQPEAPQMSPEEAAQAIEAQRAAALDNGDPKAALFPPTKYTQQLMNGQ